MDLLPKCPITSCSLGDILTGQDGNKYIVCKKANTMYWEPYEDVTNVSSGSSSSNTIAQPNPIRQVKPVKEKYYWKDNNKKPRYDGKNWNGMVKSLKPKTSPNKFPAGYVWITKFSDISFVVDIQYKGYSTTQSKFWNRVYCCPPCIDANDYPYEHISDNGYYVEYDKQGNKFWCYKNSDGDHEPIQPPYKFMEGSTASDNNNRTFVSRRGNDYAYWEDYESVESEDSDEYDDSNESVESYHFTEKDTIHVPTQDDFFDQQVRLWQEMQQKERVTTIFTVKMIAEGH